MKVYVEIALLDNFFIDYLLLKAVFFTLKTKVKNKRIIYSSLLGAVFAVISPLLELPPAIFIALKILFAPLMLAVSHQFDGYKKLTARTLLFFLLTFAFGGTLIGLFGIFKINYELNDNFYYASEIPIWITILIALIFYRIIKIIVGYVYRKSAVIKNIIDCKVVLNGIETYAKGFIDTGNVAFDPVSNLPIVMCDKSFAKKITVFGNNTKARYINVGSVAANGKILIFEVDKIVLYCGEKENIINNVMLGISASSFKERDYQLLLHSSF